MNEDRIAPACRRIDQQDPYEIRARWRDCEPIAASGLIVLATDHTIRSRMAPCNPASGAWRSMKSRISKLAREINPTTLAAMEKDLGKSASLILAWNQTRLWSAMAATSASVVLGRGDGGQAYPGGAGRVVAVTNPITARDHGHEEARRQGASPC